jgi:hypothetical protein
MEKGGIFGPLASAKPVKISGVVGHFEFLEGGFIE